MQTIIAWLLSVSKTVAPVRSRTTAATAWKVFG